MGTLYDQQPRVKYDNQDKNREQVIHDVVRLVEGDGFTNAEAIEILKVAEMRRQNNLYRIDGDAWDEQIAGIGRILESISDAIRSNSDNL